jgi:hypothetical protein
MGAALFTFRTAPAATAPSLAGIVLEYRMCCPSAIAVFKTDSACRLVFPDGHTAGIDNPGTIENIGAALSPTLPDGSILEFFGGRISRQPNGRDELPGGRMGMVCRLAARGAPPPHVSVRKSGVKKGQRHVSWQYQRGRDGVETRL